MKKVLLLLAAVVLFSTVSTAAPVMIAGTSFENETPGGEYFDTGDPAVTHDLVNHPGQSPVNSTAVSSNAGDLGFHATFVSTGYDYEGITDGTDVGVVNDTSDVGYYPAGTQGYEISDTDGAFVLTFDSVDLTAYTNATVFMYFFINETGWENDDYLKISLLLDGNAINLLDTTGQDIDNYYHEYEGEWTPIGYGIGDAVSSVTLIVESWSQADTEKFYLDDVRFQGEPVPEPVTVVLLAFGGLAALRKRK